MRSDTSQPETKLVPYHEGRGVTLYCGDALTVLRSMPDESVQCVVTSPPYHGLRNYKTSPQIWDGDGNCNHQFAEAIRNPKADPRSPELKALQGATVGTNLSSIDWSNGDMGSFCVRCGAWRGELGLEPTFFLYVAHLIQIFAEVKRVLKKDGTCFVNIGDSYGTNSGNAPSISAGKVATASKEAVQTRYSNPHIEQPKSLHKSLLNIPARFAIAMTDELRFIQRNEIIWLKRACMPSSAKDRFTVDFEPVFFFAKNPKYKFNQQLEALAESTRSDYRILTRSFTQERPERGYPASPGRGSGMLKPSRRPDRGYPDGQPSRSGGDNIPTYEEGRNKRCVWDVPFEPNNFDHYASYPTKLVEPMILAGTDEGDVLLDPFNGTGTTGVTAIRERRQYIGIELNEKDVKTTQRRLKSLQVNLI